ncbi:unnamed protein product [Camellia sinensis]
MDMDFHPIMLSVLLPECLCCTVRKLHCFSTSASALLYWKKDTACLEKSGQQPKSSGQQATNSGLPSSKSGMSATNVGSFLQQQRTNRAQTKVFSGDVCSPCLSLLASRSKEG